MQGREMLQEEQRQKEADQAAAKDVEKKLRAATEENSLLKFHNNRLTKKVEALQKRLTDV